LALAVALAAAVIARLDWQGGRSGFPAPKPAAADSGVSFEDFVGAETCGECHAAQYDAWKESTHGRAGGPPSEELVIAPFNGVPIRFKDAMVTPMRTEEGDYVFRVEQQGRPVEVYRVVQVVGGGHMVGGGTQGFFADSPDGTLRFIPFDYSRHTGVWFCQTNGRTDKGWFPITPEIALAECADWPPARVMGSHPRFRNCEQCHGSQVLLEFDAEARRYRTRFTTLRINCESCHGPGRRHVELARSGKISETADIGMRSLATLDKDESLEVCFRCHAVKDEIQPGYLPGKPLEEYFGLKLPFLGTRPLLPDGRIRQFAYQQQHLYSDCYLNGSMTCVDCHEPHSQRYRDIWGEPLAGRLSNGQCLDCHPSKAEPLERHTRHPAESPGSRCVACHMPYLQEPDVGPRIRYSRSDHTIPIPRPRLDAVLGVQNACQKCHTDRSLRELQAQVEDWYGELKPLKDLIDGLLRAQSAGSRWAAAQLMLAPGPPYVALQFTALAYFFLSYLDPDMPGLEAGIVERLEALSRSDDVDLQALALASLHFARGEDPAVRSFLGEELKRLAARDAMVRRRWVWILNFRGDIYTARGRHRLALTAYGKAQEILPDDPGVLRNLGIAYVNLGVYQEAISNFRRSLELDPVQPLTLVSLAFALTESGDFDSGLAAYRRAIELDPWEPKAYLSLGNAYVRRGAMEDAVEAYSRAVDLDPSLAEAHFALGAIYARQNDYDRAVAALRRGLEFDPDARGPLQLLQDIQRQAQRPAR
jgi:tetratricopeptide (TPR) repeat protein